MGKRKRTGIFIAAFLSLGLSAMACSSDDAKEEVQGDAGNFEPFDDAGEDAGEADAPLDFGDFLEVLPTDPNDIAACDEAPLEAQAGHDFCPGASCGECEDEGPPFELIARASDLGEGVRFVTMKDDLVLAESAEGKPLVYQFAYQEEEPQVRLAPVHSTFTQIPGFGGTVGNGFAVNCSKKECVILLIDERGDVRLIMSVPFEENAIEGAFLPAVEHTAPCIFGDGIHCVRLGKFETLVTGEEGRLLAEDARGRWLVGENGRVVRLQGHEASEPHHGIDTRLHTVASAFDGESAWAAGEGGVLVALGEAGPRICKAPSDDILAVTSSNSGSLAWVTKGGVWLESPHGERKRWCSITSSLSDVVAVSVMDCEPSKLRRMLTPTELWGQVRGMYECLPPPPPPEDDGFRKPPMTPPGGPWPSGPMRER